MTQPINAAQDFVLSPLSKDAAGNPALAAALATYRAASPAQQLKWANAYAGAVTKVKFVGGVPVVPAAADGPVPVMLANELTMARSGALDSDLLAKQPVLRHQLHQAAAVHRGRRLLRQPGDGHAPDR